MSHLAHVLFLAATLLKPILVTKSDLAFDQLGIPQELRTYEAAVALNKLGGLKVAKGEPLFPRLNANEEIEYLKEVISSPKEKAAA